MDEAARRSLLAWYRAARRDLPWRRTKDPYAIWVSEAMLQQTRVDVAAPYYERWLRRWPRVLDLAGAGEEEVLAQWSGLGYYSRARNLHKAARAVAGEQGGRLPASVEGLRALPGVGPYTAAAVASIAFGLPVACVDGNVTRVVARFAGLRGALDAKARTRIGSLAQAWLDPAMPGDWNQAMMELGATVCTPRRPRCGACPVAAACASRGRDPEAVPRKAPSAKVRVETVRFAVVRRRGHVLLVRAPRGGLLGGLLGLPGGAGREPLGKQVEGQTGVRATLARPAAALRHQFSHRTWEMRVHAAAWKAGEPVGEARWVAEADLPGAALSAAARKALRACGVEA
ncbi:MAG TPA: A/G-specific adenine glycosylase [Candidatus Thermoplasmatota archaeon]|nr:A/G-specific adenine glycosylase [Candidatus Thermoplasmatota archaeon]